MSFLWLWLYAWFGAGMLAQTAPSVDTLLLRASQQGTPLVDRIEGDGRYVMVTFLWRGRAETNNIAVIGTFSRHRSLG